MPKIGAGGGGSTPVTLVVAASDSLDASRADYQCDGVVDEVEIEQAIADLPAQGGVIQLLEGTFNISTPIDILKSNVVLRGQGRSTIIFLSNGSNCRMIIIGDGATALTGVEVRDMELDGNSANNTGNCRGVYVWGGSGLYIDNLVIDGLYVHDTEDSCVYIYLARYATISNNELGPTKSNGLYMSDFYDCRILNNYIHDSDQTGLLGIADCNYNTIRDNTIDTPGTHGIDLDEPNDCIVANNHIRGNPTDGIGIFLHDQDSEPDNLGNTIIGNNIYDMWRGIYISTSTPNDRNLIIGNHIVKMRREGIYSGGDKCSIVDNFFFHVCMDANNTYDAIYVSGDYNLIAQNYIHSRDIGNVPRYAINIAGGSYNSVEGNNLVYSRWATAPINDAGTVTYIDSDNEGITPDLIKEYRNVKNTSGGALAAGDVVVLKAVAAGNEVTTTVNQGDDKVYGMAAEAIANGAYGYVQVKGKTTVLKVNGTVDIAIGDPLGTYTAAGIAMKAGAGDQAFAIALEAYTTDDSNGVIDAYIKSPWD